MLLHRKNNYEWRYIGLWFDMLPELIQFRIKPQIQGYNTEEVFVLFEPCSNPFEMIQKNLSIRNTIPAVIDANYKKKIDQRNMVFQKFDAAKDAFINELSNTSSELYLYINDKNLFKTILLNL